MVFDAAHIFRTIAEKGLSQRKIHLWIGDDLILQWLSPYVRDLRNVMTAWAQHNIHGEDEFYESIPRFLAADGRLTDERIRADRSVGISHYSAGFDVIDTARLDPTAWDPRIKSASQGAVIVRIDPNIDCDLIEIACGLQEQLAHFSGVWIALHGVSVQGRHTIVIPNALLDLDSGEHVPWSQKPVRALPNTLTGSLLAAPSLDTITDHALPEAHLLQALVFGHLDWLSSLWNNDPIHPIPTHIAIVGHPDLSSTATRQSLEIQAHILRPWLQTILS